MSNIRETIEERRKSCEAFCLQDWDELAELGSLVEHLRPKTVVEIGSCEFGWPWVLAPFFARGATIIGIDPLTKNIVRPEKTHRNIKKLEALGFDVHFLKGCSHEPWVINDMVRFLKGRKIDLLHIDGAHGYKAVKYDWETYSQYVREGGLIAFHDIHSTAAAEQVFQVWNEIKTEGSWTTEEIGNQNRVGIGVIHYSQKPAKVKTIEGYLVGIGRHMRETTFDDDNDHQGFRSFKPVDAYWLTLWDPIPTKNVCVQTTRFNLPKELAKETQELLGMIVRISVDSSGAIITSITKIADPVEGVPTNIILLEDPPPLQ